MNKYEVVKGVILTEFIELVNSFVEKGYVPLGEMIMVNGTMYQTLWRELPTHCCDRCFEWVNKKKKYSWDYQ